MGVIVKEALANGRLTAAERRPGLRRPAAAARRGGLPPGDDPRRPRPGRRPRPPLGRRRAERRGHGRTAPLEPGRGGRSNGTIRPARGSIPLPKTRKSTGPSGPGCRGTERGRHGRVFRVHVAGSSQRVSVRSSTFPPGRRWPKGRMRGFGLPGSLVPPGGRPVPQPRPFIPRQAGGRSQVKAPHPRPRGTSSRGRR